MDDSTIDILFQVVAIYSLFLIVFGTCGNVLSLLVCLRKNLRNVPTFIFYAFIMANDTIALYFWNLDHFFIAYYNYEAERISLSLCHFFNLLQSFSLQSSACLLATMSLERCLSGMIKTWRLKHYKSKHAVITSVAICSIIFIIVTILTFSINLNDDNGQPTNITCYETKGYNRLIIEHDIVYFLIPVVLIVICNTILIFKSILKSNKKVIQRSNENEAKRISITLSVIILTTTFIVSILPTSIIGVFLLDVLYPTKSGLLIIFAFDCLLFTYHSCNFIILMLSNKRFRVEFTKMLKLIKSEGNSLITTGKNIVSPS